MVSCFSPSPNGGKRQHGKLRPFAAGQREKGPGERQLMLRHPLQSKTQRNNEAVSRAGLLLASIPLHLAVLGGQFNYAAASLSL